MTGPHVDHAPGPAPPFVPPRRDRSTRRSVVIVDRAADWTIRIGGVCVMAAVFGIMVFLADVVIPLFSDSEASAPIDFAMPAGEAAVLATLVDEYRSMVAVLDAGGGVRVVHLGTGRQLAVPDFRLGEGRVTSFDRTLRSGDIAFGFEDGTVAFGRLDFSVEVLEASTRPSSLEDLGGGAYTDGSVLYANAPGGKVRRLAVTVMLDEPQQVAPPGTPVLGLDLRVGGSVERPTRALASIAADGVARLSIAASRKNLLTGAVRTAVETTELPRVSGLDGFVALLMTEKADQVYVALDDGTVHRFDTRVFAKPVLAETRDLLEGDARLTTAGFLIGEQSLVVGGADGTVDIYFRLPEAGAGTADGYRLVRAHRLERHDGAVSAFSPSQRSKVFATADDRGAVWIRHATSEQTLAKLAPAAPATSAYTGLVLAPRENAVVAANADRAIAWALDIPHPETTLASIFGKVWYEGYSEPGYTWQSSSGEDSFEPKFSLVPLIFGTIKATLYSLLFAIPIALLSAIYTSEFIHHRVRAIVKPAMEMMASLPSVVLGFIAALILAPIIESWIAAVMFAFVVLPVSLLAAAYLWQLVPGPLARRLDGLPKLALMFAVLAIGALLTVELGPAFEALFFAGDLKAWANGDIGSAAPFLALLLMPLAFVGLWWLQQRLLGERLEARIRGLPQSRAGAVDAARWAAVGTLAIAVSFGLAGTLAAAGIDARGALVDTYVQRNTLVVGFAMGFAVIPIIYTIAEDALNSVPEHLRAASLACGATRWQSATRIILPTAVSGVFAAVMIGMGRAVGETMIVVMAAGNTPLLEWNVFNGLRALSANIAVELPEAVKDGSLYRMLFLAALVLFVMTFVVNTIAEVVRLRFRRRASQL
jgi:phosphate transport system permease protein